MKYAKRIFQHYLKFGLEANGYSLDMTEREEIAAAVEDIVKAAVKEVEERYEARIARMEYELSQHKKFLESQLEQNRILRDLCQTNHNTLLSLMSLFDTIPQGDES